jgi:methylenetetrahydrofolate dehydrogenase (NADP+) / methenyltetrahydrofolate cyclohydrolase
VWTNPPVRQPGAAASHIVGKSMTLMLMQRDATVSVCHAKTRDLAQFTIPADILIVAAGKERTS